MKRIWIVAALTIAAAVGACGGSNENQESSNANAPAGAPTATQVAFTEAELDNFERGLRSEIEAVTAAQERGDAMQAQWESATIPVGAEASGLSDARYRDVRGGVDRVFTTLDFQ